MPRQRRQGLAGAGFAGQDRGPPGAIGSALRLDRAGEALGFVGFAVKLGRLDVAHDHQAHAGVVGFEHHGDRILLAQAWHHLLQRHHHVFHRVDRIVMQQHLVARGGFAQPIRGLIDHGGAAGGAAQRPMHR